MSKARKTLYLEEFVGSDGEIYATPIFANSSIDSNLLLDLLCSSVLKPSGHGCSDGDGNDGSTGGVSLSG